MELTDIRGVGDATLAKLNKLGVYTVEDLIDFLPVDYVDMCRLSEYEDIVDGEFILLKVNVLSVRSNGYRYGRVSCIRAKAECDGGQEIELVWFNAPYIAHTLEEGETLVYGVISYTGKRYTMVNPTLAKVGDIGRVQGIKAVYPLHGLISNSTFTRIVREALAAYKPECFVPGVFDLEAAYHNVHIPESFEDIERGREILCLYDIVRDLAAYRLVREEREDKTISDYSYPMAEEMAMPYPLTQSQKRAVNDIWQDLRTDKCMNRLILGDVGSGKTAVAILAMCIVAERGEQAVLLAPTEILCRQHYDTAVKLLSGFGYRIAILCGDIDKSERKFIEERLISGEIDLLFATHSCLSDNIIFRDLKLAVIDELHKFGVTEKSRLVSKGKGVNLLSLSATPVPRSLAMNIYGDLDISVLDKRDGIRDNVRTYIFGSDKLERMYGYIAKTAKAGEKCFVVCPRLKGQNKDDIYSCINMYRLLSNKYVDSDQIALLHGGMSDREKAKAMNAFRTGEATVVVATTVIEVGIDVPDARKIFVIGADCHGLATLHQLRGRVGRDGGNAECFLHVRSNKVPKRIEAMKTCTDGIRLSEIDAKERGYGDLIGHRQSGKSSYDRYHIRVTLDMIRRAKAIADMVELDRIREELIKEEMQRAKRTVLN